MNNEIKWYYRESIFHGEPRKTIVSSLENGKSFSRSTILLKFSMLLKRPISLGNLFLPSLDPRVPAPRPFAVQLTLLFHYRIKARPPARPLPHRVGVAESRVTSLKRHARSNHMEIQQSIFAYNILRPFRKRVRQKSARARSTFNTAERPFSLAYISIV